jgi:hypothetical protein
MVFPIEVAVHELNLSIGVHDLVELLVTLDLGQSLLVLDGSNVVFVTTGTVLKHEQFVLVLRSDKRLDWWELFQWGGDTILVQDGLELLPFTLCHFVVRLVVELTHLFGGVGSIVDVNSFVRCVFWPMIILPIIVKVQDK